MSASRSKGPNRRQVGGGSAAAIALAAAAPAVATAAVPGARPRAIVFGTEPAPTDPTPWDARSVEHRVVGPGRRSIGCFGLDGAGLNGPCAAVPGADGTVHVIDRGNARIQVFSDGGSHLRSYGTPGKAASDRSPGQYGPGELFAPRAIAVDEAGFAYVLDAAPGYVHVFDAEGNAVDQVVVQVRDTPAAPIAAGWLEDGRLYVQVRKE
ncbi:MAG: hypothetical protein GY898_26335 [Proteobacteria bacterium]|nr:hypothetical protein [Pseudomonadota bacterium]